MIGLAVDEADRGRGIDERLFVLRGADDDLLPVDGRFLRHVDGLGRRASAPGRPAAARRPAAAPRQPAAQASAIRHAPATLRMHMHQLLHSQMSWWFTSVQRGRMAARVGALYYSRRSGQEPSGDGSSHARTPSRDKRVGMTRHPAPPAFTASTSRRRAEAVGPASRVRDPPSPPAPFTFQPHAPCERATAMTPRAASLTSAGWSAACAAVFSHMAAPERGQISGRRRVARGRGGVAQPIERPERAGVRLECGDDAPVHVRRIVRASEIHEKQPLIESPPGLGGQRHRVDGRVGVRAHLDEVHATMGRANLILDARLASKPLCFDGMGRAGNSGRIHAPAAEMLEARRSSATVTAALVPVAAPAGMSEWIVISTLALARHAHVCDRRLDQRVCAPRRPRRRLEPLAEVLGVHHDTSCLSRRRRGDDLDLDVRRHGDAEHLPCRANQVSVHRRSHRCGRGRGR